MPVRQTPEPAPDAHLDETYVHLLRLGDLISGGIWGVPAGVGFLFMGVAALSLVAGVGSGQGSGGRTNLGSPEWAVLGMGLFLFMAGMTCLKLWVARNLDRRMSRNVCLAAAGLSCLELPYGTLFGIFSFMVLARPGVKAGFPGAGFPGADGRTQDSRTSVSRTSTSRTSTSRTSTSRTSVSRTSTAQP